MTLIHLHCVAPFAFGLLVFQRRIPDRDRHFNSYFCRPVLFYAPLMHCCSNRSLYAQVLVAACATTGATLCYLISSFLGKEILTRLVPSMLETFRDKVCCILMRGAQYDCACSVIRSE